MRNGRFDDYSGWIKLHRKMLDWEWFTDVNTSHLFQYCLLKANHEDKKWQGITISKGSFITSYEKLAKETGLTVRQVRTSIDKLKLTGELTHTSTVKYSMISIKNYNQYQDIDRQVDRLATGERQTNDRLATTNKNEKNERTKEEESIFQKKKFFSESDFSAGNAIKNIAALNKEEQEGAEGCAAQKTKRFIPPQLSAVERYCNERQNGIDPQKFVDFYEARGWMSGKTKIKDWKAAVRTWERQNTKSSTWQETHGFY